MTVLAPAGAADSAAHMTGGYLAVDHPDHPMFTARLGLTIAELAGGHDGQPAVTAKVAPTAIQTADAYIARESLTSPVAVPVTPETRTSLQGTIRRAASRTRSRQHSWGGTPSIADSEVFPQVCKGVT